MGNRMSPSEDAQRFRDGYPGLEEEEDQDTVDNLLFHQNTLCSRSHDPTTGTIEEIHTQWFGDYKKLEYYHGYIQWLFPIREHGMNQESQALTLKEKNAIRADPACKARVVKSYALYMDFAGYTLVDEETGALIPSREHAERNHNLNSHGHNFLRITRIVKCLGELGLEHLIEPMLTTLMQDAFVTGNLAKCRGSFFEYWIPVVRDDAVRAKLMTTAKALQAQYCPEPQESDSEDGSGVGSDSGDDAAAAAGGGGGGRTTKFATRQKKKGPMDAFVSRSSSSNSSGSKGSGGGSGNDDDQPKPQKSRSA